MRPDLSHLELEQFPACHGLDRQFGNASFDRTNNSACSSHRKLQDCDGHTAYDRRIPNPLHSLSGVDLYTNGGVPLRVSLQDDRGDHRGGF